MNEISTRTNPNTLPAPSHEVALLDRLICWQPADHREPLGITRPLTVSERRMVEGRAAHLGECLAQRGGSSSKASVSALMLAYPSNRANSEEAKAIIAAYEFALAELPGWAVAEAVQRFIRGKVAGSNPAFAPSAAELRQEAEKVANPAREEREHLRRLLVAVPREHIPTAEEHARVAAGFDTLRASLEGNAKPTKADERSTARSALEARLIALGRDPSELDSLPEVKGAFDQLKPGNLAG